MEATRDGLHVINCRTMSWCPSRLSRVWSSWYVRITSTSLICISEGRMTDESQLHKPVTHQYGWGAYVSRFTTLTHLYGWGVHELRFTSLSLISIGKGARVTIHYPLTYQHRWEEHESRFTIPSLISIGEGRMSYASLSPHLSVLVRGVWVTLHYPLTYQYRWGVYESGFTSPSLICMGEGAWVALQKPFTHLYGWGRMSHASQALHSSEWVRGAWDRWVIASPSVHCAAASVCVKITPLVQVLHDNSCCYTSSL